MTTTIYLLIAAAGFIIAAIGAFGCIARPKPEDQANQNASWIGPKPEVHEGKPWGKPAVIIGALALVYGLMQGVSGKMSDSTPSYIKNSANKHVALIERQAEHLGVILGELAPNSNILTIHLPLLPNEQALIERKLAATKANLPENTMISATAYVDWPSGITPSAGKRIGNGPSKWWQAADFKSKINAQPFPVSAVVTDMPLPADFRKSKLWNDATIEWPLIIVVDTDPRGLDTFLSEKIIKAVIVSTPGFNPRALAEIPDNAETLWNQSKLVITLENLDEIKGRYPNLFR